MVFLMLTLGAFVIPHYSVVPALVGITLLAWFLLEWVLFQTRSLAALSKLKVTRRVLQGGREVPMVWSGLAFEVRVAVENPSVIGIPFAILEDRAAVATERVHGSAKLFAALAPGTSVELVYRLKTPAPGLLRFEGIEIRVADLQGFFYRRVFLRAEAEYLILPPLTNDEGRQRATKRFNTLPAPGIHRLRRPGSGSELLDLRDYRPGDPPKMIAWKSSARRDRLITKEFENDVPVRCVLFLDTTEGVRLGPSGNTLLTRLAGVAAVVAQASAANRDLVGLTTFDEHDARSIAPARTKIHLINILRRLAEVSALQPGVQGVPADALTRRVYPLAQELYPELMANKINTMTFGRLWIPLLDRKWGWLVFGAIVTGLVLFILGSWGFTARILSPRSLVDEGDFATKTWRWILRNARAWFVRSIDDAALLTPSSMHFLVKIAWLNAMFVLTYFPPATLGLIFWFFHSIRGWYGERKRLLTRRKQIGALFSLQDGTGVNGVERYVHDDELYSRRVGQFLQHHLLRCPIPLYDDQGHYRFRCSAKSVVLATALIRAVSHARDNELYVILADLAELGADIAPIVKACRVARARHHHVLVIVPWPSDVPSLDQAEAATTPSETKTTKHQEREARRETKPRSTRKLRKRKPKEPAKMMLNAVRLSLTQQYHESFRLLRRQLTQVGATVMRMDDGDPVRLVLDRLDRLRGMRSRR